MPLEASVCIDDVSVQVWSNHIEVILEGGLPVCTRYTEDKEQFVGQLDLLSKLFSTAAARIKEKVNDG